MIRSILENSGRGAVRVSAIVTLVTLLTGIVIVWAVQRNAAITSEASGGVLAAVITDHPDQSLIEATLWQCGCEPASLAAVGVSSTSEVNGVLAGAVEWFAVNETALRGARADVADARIAAARINRSLRRGEGTFDSEDLAVAHAAVSSSEQELDTLLSDLRADAFAGLSATQEADLNLVADHRMSGFAPEFAVVNPSESDIIAVKRCMRVDLQRRTEGDEAVLDHIEAMPKYTTAAAARSVNESSVTAAWEQYWQPG